MSVWRHCVLAPWRPGARFMCAIRTDIDEGVKLSWLPTGRLSVQPTFSAAGILEVPTSGVWTQYRRFQFLQEMCQKSTE